MNRRRFVCALGGAVGLGWGVSLLRSGADRSPVPATGLPSVQRTARALGSDVTIKAYHSDPALATVAVEAAFSELELIEGLMSLYRPDSQLCRLNREGRLLDPHPYFAQILLRAERLSCRTGGAFDITVQPLWRLYTESLNSGDLPEAAAIEQVRKAIGWQRVRSVAGEVRLDGEGTQITLNGIAQGYAADRVVEALRRHGIRHALVDTGEIAACGIREDGRDWSAGIQHPRHADAFVAVASLGDRCLATSGDYATSFTPDRKHHHLFDPHTGVSPQHVASVSVIAPLASEADALSTAAFVLGPEAGFRFIQATTDADALFVLKDGRLRKTAGFPTIEPARSQELAT